MSTKLAFSIMTSALISIGGSNGKAQQPTGTWNPSTDTHVSLVITAERGGASSIELTLNQSTLLVVSPTFRDEKDVCVSSLRFGFDPTVLDHAAAGWIVEARLVDIQPSEVTFDLKWTRRVNRSDLSPSDPYASQQRVTLREGDSRILDLVRTTHRPSTGCDSFGLTYGVEMNGARELSDAAIAYDVWLVEHDADGELTTDRYRVAARQGQPVEYFFKPMAYTAAGRRADNSDRAILMEVSGSIRGRLRTDGNIDLMVDGRRSFSDAQQSAMTASNGRTMLTVKPGETIEVLTDLAIPGSLARFGDLNTIFRGHRTAVRITATRLW